MKVNLPVTQIETIVEEGKILVSNTDLKGLITEANSNFVEVSGFSRQELIGVNHNLVRHPDVPARVFEDLWETLQAGEPWSQVVKNRCKNGNHYWVEANVTPVFDGDEVVGYISVRKAANRDLIAPTEEAYRRIEQGEWLISRGKVYTSQWEMRRAKFNFFREMKISTRLIATAAMAFVTLLGLLGIVYSEQSEQIAFRDKERLGIESILSLRNLAEHLPQHRGMGNAYLNGDSSFKEKLNQVEQKIAQDLANVRQVDSAVGKQLKTSGRVSDLEKEWEQLKGRWTGMSAAESFKEHSHLIQGVLDLVSHVGDSSNLILDPDLDTFYLMDAIVNRGLQLTDVTGQLRGFGSGVVARGELSNDDLRRIAELKIRGDLLTAGLIRTLTRASEANDDTGRQLSMAIGGLESAAAAWKKQVELINSGALNATTSDQFFSDGSTMISAVFTVFDQSAVQLNKLLSERIESKEAALSFSAVVTIMVLLLIGWVTVRLIRSIVEPLDHASSVMKQIASGNYSNQIEHAGNDEVAAMLMRLKSMQIKSGADLNEITERANATSRIKMALDGATTNIMIADHNRNIVYMNPAVTEMLRKNERALQQELSGFRVDNLLGNSIDQFHKNPQHQANLLSTFTQTYNTQIRVAGRIFNLSANPVITAEGERLGASVEWADVTEQVLGEEMVENLVRGAADGDLSQRLDSTRFDGFMSRMAEGVNDLMDTFNDVLVQTRIVIDQVNESVGQVRISSQDLASASQEQSSAIEQVSSSLEETDSQVKSNAMNAGVANQLVQETNNVADEGQQKMREMIHSMDGISSSSQDIAKIIKVIDEIAFQTNLLALNAAVEAARAGKYGKGFAVVAQEVRDLAGRSAEAAKETAELIEQSTQQVADGVKVADATAGSLEGIVENVAKVRDLVAEISTASDEQTRGITQIADAITQISDGSQSSSQQSLEMASAADELASLTDQLASEVARFQLHEGAQGMRPVAAPAPRPVVATAVTEAVEVEEPAPAAIAAPHEVLPLDQDERDFGDF